MGGGGHAAGTMHAVLLRIDAVVARSREGAGGHERGERTYRAGASAPREPGGQAMQRRRAEQRELGDGDEC